MNPVSLIRTVAAIDLLVTLPLAMPVISEFYVAWLFSGFGLIEVEPGLLPLTVSAALFCNLAGMLGVLWNGARCIRPQESWLAHLDLRGRLAVAALLGYYLLALDAPAMLWLFVFTELAGAVAQKLALRKIP